MFTYTTPEKVGVSTADIKKFIKILNDSQYAIHSIIMARGNQIFFHKYWEPFNEDFLHRMYSVSKSFVSLAIGFLAQDGKIDLDDKLFKYFPDESKNQTDENMKNQTIRHTLMMSTAKLERNWFIAKTDDRVRFYFENDIPESRPSGTIFQYDSSGSFILGALVERVTGMNLADYLKEKLFDKIGVEGAYFLKCPGGHSWGDSALIMRSIDLMRTARFVLNGGSWNGEQILNKKYIKEATSFQIDNSSFGLGDYCDQGYGYLFWRTFRNSFFFNGMGSQYAICSPDKDMIFVINADTMETSFAKPKIIDNYFNIIYDNTVDYELPEYTGEPICANKMVYLENTIIPPMQDKINGKKFIMQTNKMGISEFTINFGNDGNCEFNYINEQGYKTINFGLGKNVSGIFPHEGYNDEVATVYAPGHFFKCMTSAKWTSNTQLLIQRALNPAKISSIVLGGEDDKIKVYMLPDEVKKGIGKGGCNIKLAGMLVGKEIEVWRELPKDDVEAEEEDVLLSEFDDVIDAWIIERLQSIGCDTAKSVLALSAADIAKRADLEDETVEEIIDILSAEFEDEE